MSSYSDMARERKHARSLYLELRALGLDVRLEEDTEEPLCYRVVVGGLRSLSPAHADRVVRCVQGNEAGLVQVLLCRWDPDLHAVRREGNLGWRPRR